MSNKLWLNSGPLQEEGGYVSPVFGRSVNPISTRGGTLSPPSTASHPGFSDLATALRVRRCGSPKQCWWTCRRFSACTSAMPAWALFYLCTTSRLEGSTARSAARQPAACRRVLVARAHLIGSELKVTKLEEFFSLLPYTPHTYTQNHWLMDQRSIFINTSSIQSK